MNSCDDSELWSRISGHALQVGVRRDLIDVLAESGLSRRQAGIAVLEYRRFIFLLATGPAAASPLLRGIWRQHVLHADAYDDFCDSVLGKRLVFPLSVPEIRSDPLYSETRRRYLGRLGTAPDVRVWPDPAMLALRRWAPVAAIPGLMFAEFGHDRGLWVVTLFGAVVAAVPLGLIWRYSPWRLSQDAVEIEIGTVDRDETGGGDDGDGD